MEDFFPVLVILIGAVASIVSSAKKEQAKQAAQAHRQSEAAARIRAAVEGQRAAAAKTAPAPAAPIQPAQPMVHPHIQPDCETHDAPGSLGTVSTEGKDPCHEPMLTHARMPQEDEAEQPALTFDWSGENLVKAFVMQEILTRPAQRQVR